VYDIIHCTLFICVLINKGEEPDEDDAYALMASLKRLYAFWS